MTTVEKPHLGLEYRAWQETRWGRIRYWLAHREEHKRGPAYFNPDHRWAHRAEFEDDGAADELAHPAPEELGESAPEDAPPSRWESLAQDARTVALWCASALSVVVLFDPAPWFLALVIGAAGAALVLQRAAHQRAVAAVAQEIEEERAELAARLQRAERQEQNRAAHEAERAKREAEAAAAREAKRAANRAAHRGGEASE